MKLKCINVGFLKQLDTSIFKGETNDHKPKLEFGKIYELKETLLDDLGFPHYDVGIASSVNTIRSIHTGKVLERSGSIHWCHPSRFEEVDDNTQSLETEVDA